jgi:type IV pilus assembly protein PilQ
MVERTGNEQKRLGLGLKMFSKLKSLMAVAVLGLGANLAWGLTLNDIDFASMPGDRTEVRLAFDGTPPSPSGYTIEQPARIALDLPGVSSGLEERYHNLGVGNAQSMTVIDAKDRTRLIFNLSQLVPYDTRVTGNQLVVTLGASASGDTASSTGQGTAQLAEQQTSNTQPAQSGPSVTDVDFRRGNAGDGQVIVTLSDPKINVDLSEEAGNIRLRLPDTALPESERRRLDVNDFATPVSQIESYTQDGDVIIEIDAEGEYDYLAYQSGNQFTVAVEELSEQEAVDRREEKFPYTGEKLSLNFQDIEVRSVLQLIADFTGLNLVASDTVDGSITLRLDSVPWDQALELILKTKGLDKRQVGNVLLVAPASEIANRERLELEANRQQRELAPVRLDIIQVNYAKAADLVTLLQQDEELISGRGFISSDARTNTISVRETAEKLEQIRRLVNTWDIPVRQVLIEARIVRAQTNVARDLGVQWGGAFWKQDGEDRYRVGGSIGTLTEASEILNSGGGGISFPGALAVDLGVTAANTSSIAIGYGRGDFLIDLELSALESDGKAEIVAQPKVVTADRQTAIIESGEEIPYQEASSSGATSVSFKEAVLGLEVTPQITPDDNIIMDLVVSQDSRGEVTAGIPSINTNEVQTQVLVANGETVVLGGIFQSEVATTITKTPFLGDIPYLGRLFTKTEKIDERSELLIFITPKIVKSSLTSD